MAPMAPMAQVNTIHYRLLACLFPLALLKVAVAQTAVLVPLASEDFEHSAPYRYTVNVALANKLPQVSSSPTSTAAARSGIRGLSVTVKNIDTARPGYQAELVTSRFALNASHVYTWTFYAKASKQVTTTIALLQAGSYQPAAAKGIVLTTKWTLFAIATVAPLAFNPAVPDTALHFFQVQLGNSANVVYSFDDLKVTSDYLDLSWGEPAQVAARIKAKRTSQLSLNITDAVGMPLGSVDQLQLSLSTHAFPFGAAMAPEYHVNDSWYTATAAALFPGAVTQENAFKWPFYEPQPNDTAAGAGLMQSMRTNYVQANNISLWRGHTLEWGQDYVNCMFDSSQCFWGLARMANGSFNCTQYRANVMARIRRDVTLYADKGGPERGMMQFDVWNEVLHVPGLLDVCGWGLLDEAFIVANQASPTARLCLNDFSLIESDDWVQMVELVSGMLGRGVPVHCVAIEQHLTAFTTNSALMAVRLNRLAQLGLPLIISEFSLNTGWPATGNPALTLTELQQSQEVTRLVSQWFSHPAVNGIVFWCFWDGQCFVQNGGFFYANHTAKAAARDLIDLMHGNWSSSYSGVAGTNGAHDFTTGPAVFDGIFGDYALQFRHQGNTYSGQVSFKSPLTAAGAVQTPVTSLTVTLKQLTNTVAIGAVK